jgi:hypothetical protein
MSFNLIVFVTPLLNATATFLEQCISLVVAVLERWIGLQEANRSAPMSRVCLASRLRNDDVSIVPTQRVTEGYGQNLGLTSTEQNSERMSCVRFEIFTSVTMKNGIFWDVRPCGSCKIRCFGGT